MKRYDTGGRPSARCETSCTPVASEGGGGRSTHGRAVRGAHVLGVRAVRGAYVLGVRAVRGTHGHGLLSLEDTLSSES